MGDLRRRRSRDEVPPDAFPEDNPFNNSTDDMTLNFLVGFLAFLALYQCMCKRRKTDTDTNKDGALAAFVKAAEAVRQTIAGFKAAEAVKAKFEDKKQGALELREALELTLRDLAEKNTRLSNVLQRFGWTKSTTEGVETWQFEKWPNPKLKDLLSELEEKRPPIRCFKKKKDLRTAFLLYTVGGLVGAHHFYLDRLLHAMVCSWSANFLGLGWIIDGLLMKWYVSSHNRDSCAEDAPYDEIWGRLTKWLGILCVLLSMFAGPALTNLPMVLHNNGHVDVLTPLLPKQDPYRTIGIRNADAPYSDMKKAYEKLAQKWDPAQNSSCDQACDDEWFEISDAWFHVRKAKAPEEITSIEWVKDIASQWKVVFEVAFRAINEELRKAEFQNGQQ